jgi:hypothetical protein
MVGRLEDKHQSTEDTWAPRLNTWALLRQALGQTAAAVVVAEPILAQALGAALEAVEPLEEAQMLVEIVVVRLTLLVLLVALLQFSQAGHEI